MTAPQFIPSMPFAEYLADPCDRPSLTSGIVRDLLVKAPRRVWQETPRLNPNAQPTQKTTFDLGSATHALFTGSGDPIRVIDADAFNTKDAKAARDAAYRAGQTPILAKHMSRVEAMAEAARDQIQQNPDIGQFFTPNSRDELVPEATITWSEGGVMHRCRPDFYHPIENVVIHYKTTDTMISPATLARYAAGAGWHLTAAHYRAGAKALAGTEPRQFFAIQETAPPHMMLVAEMDATFLGTAAMRRDRSIEIWARCLRDNTWPGMLSRTIRLECPEWLERDMIAEKDAEEAAKAADLDLLDLATRWQAPLDASQY